MNNSQNKASSTQSQGSNMNSISNSIRKYWNSTTCSTRQPVINSNRVTTINVQGNLVSRLFLNFFVLIDARIW